jgi:hypothetical protein
VKHEHLMGDVIAAHAKDTVAAMSEVICPQSVIAYHF